MRRLGLALAGAALAAWALWPRDVTTDAEPAGAAPGEPPAPAQIAAPVARDPRLPAELARKYPPGTTVSFSTVLDPRDFTEGIGCPGGGFLPLLNGVPFAQPLHRNTELFGPVPPVIGKRVDAEGSEWYLHADGSETCTRWVTMQVQGVDRRDVRTDHTVPARQEHGLTPPPRASDR